MALAHDVHLIASVHAVEVAVAGRYADLLKGGAHDLVVVEGGHADAGGESVRDGVPEFLRRVAVDSQGDVRRLVFLFRRQFQYIVGQPVRIVVPVLVGAGEAEVPRSRVVEDLPETGENVSDLLFVLRYLVGALHELIETAGGVDPVEGEYHPEDLARGREIVRGLSRHHLEGACRRLVSLFVGGIFALCRFFQRQGVESVAEDVQRVHGVLASAVEPVAVLGVDLLIFVYDLADPLRAEVDDPAEIRIGMAAPVAAPKGARLVEFDIFLRAEKTVRRPHIGIVFLPVFQDLLPHFGVIFEICLVVLPVVAEPAREMEGGAFVLRPGRYGCEDVLPERDIKIFSAFPQRVSHSFRKLLVFVLEEGESHGVKAVVFQFHCDTSQC